MVLFGKWKDTIVRKSGNLSLEVTFHNPICILGYYVYNGRIRLQCSKQKLRIHNQSLEWYNTASSDDSLNYNQPSSSLSKHPFSIHFAFPISSQLFSPSIPVPSLTNSQLGRFLLLPS